MDKESNLQQNKEQLQTPTMGVTINKESTTTEPIYGLKRKLLYLMFDRVYSHLQELLAPMVCKLQLT